MRSIFTKILLWSFGTLVVSLIAFVAISRFLSDRAFPPRRTACATRCQCRRSMPGKRSRAEGASSLRSTWNSSTHSFLMTIISPTPAERTC